MNIVLILGNQLFSSDQIKKNHAAKGSFCVFMREDFELCTYYKFHKHKIIFFLSAMRTYKAELENNDIKTHYEYLSKKDLPYEECLMTFIKKNNVKHVSFFEIEDKFFENRILSTLKNFKIPFDVWTSPMFLNSRDDFKKYLQSSKRPFMKVFYEHQRKSLNILLEKNGQPMGGSWSFDNENRKPLPLNINPKEPENISTTKITKEVQEVVETFFNEHPGFVKNFWLPTDRKGAHDWLDCFLHDRLKYFGPYEDSLPQHSDFVFHSILTPFLNTGLLTPNEVVNKTLTFAQKNEIPIASTEGFIRQIIGWREFIRGIYQNFSDQQESLNFFKHKRKLNEHWYNASTDIAPLDHVIRKVIKYGYCHHIERLMILGSLMLLLEIDPKDAYRWFMEMFIDSSDWVMAPNVFGMALFSDGGIFATKPYFCGSNYYRKMGPYKADEDWCAGVDGLYWGFIEKHKIFFSKNPRLSMMVRSLEKMEQTKKLRIYKAAELLRKKLTC